jgi:hypothetical protein
VMIAAATANPIMSLRLKVLTPLSGNAPQPLRIKLDRSD